MPRYDHRCEACEKTFEVDKPLKDAGRDVDCPDCGLPTPQVVSAPAIHWRHTPKFHP